MDWPTAGVAIASSFASASVAIWAVTSQRKTAADDRSHDAAMRRREGRGSAYIELMAALHRLQTGIERTAPMFVVGTPPEPPPPMSDEESWRLSALGDVVASEDVRTLIRKWTLKQSEFYNGVWYLRQIQQYEEGGPVPRDTVAAFGITSLDQWKNVDAIRKDLRDDLEAIGARVRSEL